MSMTQRYAGMLRRHSHEWDKQGMPVKAECLRQAARHMEELEKERDKAMRVVEKAVALVCSSAWQGVSDEDCELEQVLRDVGWVEPAVVTITPRSLRAAVAESEVELPRYCDNCLTDDACALRGICAHALREDQQTGDLNG